MNAEAGRRFVPPRRPVPVRELGEGCAIALALVPALVLLRAPWPLLVLGPAFALAWAVAWPLRVWDVPARRWAVVLARVATGWFLVAGLSVGYVSAVLLVFGGVGLLGLLWVLLGAMASLAGTFLLRERHDVAGVVLKTFVLGPLALFVAATGSPGTLALWGALVGWTALVLLVGICVTAFHAWRHDRLDPSER
ncbi:signal transduction histidine kinase [Streptacidiphilus sp. MAP12-20]|uniref:hypothetical protein n=1 Tax=Streptacidiphilus sp. MAP12-20 TaxID=3156299 RepID=UPI0035110CAA